jgi:hypothetical protein
MNSVVSPFAAGGPRTTGSKRDKNGQTATAPDHPELMPQAAEKAKHANRIGAVTLKKEAAG